MNERVVKLEALKRMLETTKKVYEMSVKDCEKKAKEFEEFMRKEHNRQFDLLNVIEGLKKQIKELA